MTQALIDGDILVYSCGFACQTTTYKLLGLEYSTLGKAKKAADATGVDHKHILPITESEPLEYCLSTVKRSMQKILKAVDAENYRVFLSGRDNFREKVPYHQQYKGHRDPAHIPVHYDAIIDYLVKVWGAEVVDGEEADDAMGIAQTESTSKGKNTIICSLDKDMKMILGKHYNWRKEEFDFVMPNEADRWFWTQMITGDSVDNITGLKGVGIKGAEKLLDGTLTNDEMCKIVMQAYIDKGYTPQEFISTGRLLWIRRKPNEIWEPPCVV